MTDTPSALLDLAVSIGIEAGELARASRAEGVNVAASKSSTEDIVTFADRETEALIRRRIKEARPDDSFLGEESGSEQGTRGLTWVVDPIDGTVNFFYGIPQYAVSIAVVDGDADPARWTALAAVVVNPATGDLFTATDGGGAFLNGQPIHVNAGVPLDQALVGTGFAYRAEARMSHARIVAELIGQVRDIRRMGSAALDLCAVACGRLDAYFERELSPWDHAAGALIAREAGARVSGPPGKAPGREFIMAADPQLSHALESALETLGAFAQ